MMRIIPIHDADNTYTWYDPNPVTNGGNAGTAGDGTDTEDFINGLNAANYGGFSDWRMPTVQELMTIVDRDKGSPAIDDFYFLNIVYYVDSVSPNYWSSTTYASNYAWGVYFYNGNVAPYGKGKGFYGCAVRSGQ